MKTEPSSVPETYRTGVDQLAKVIDVGVTLVGEDHVARGSEFDGGPLRLRDIKGASGYS